MGYVAFLCSLLLSSCPAVAAWDDYTPGTLKQIIEFHKPGLKSNGKLVDSAIVPPGVKRKVTVKNLGLTRPISENRIFAIGLWGKSMPAAAEFVRLFESEVLVEEDGIEYWLPIQRKLLPYWIDEVGSGDFATVYIMWVAWLKGDWVFLLNEFEKPLAPPNSW